MRHTLTPILTRRGLVAGALAGGVLLPGRPLAQPPSLLLPTPSATAGPFYPASFPADTDADLVRLRGSDARALGTVTHVTGRVLAADSAAVPGALVEIWQCDANGRYHHPGDTRSAAFDPAFQGYGRVRTGADGS